MAYIDAFRDLKSFIVNVRSINIFRDLKSIIEIVRLNRFFSGSKDFIVSEKEY